MKLNAVINGNRVYDFQGDVEVVVGQQFTIEVEDMKPDVKWSQTNDPVLESEIKGPVGNFKALTSGVSEQFFIVKAAVTYSFNIRVVEDIKLQGSVIVEKV